MDCAVACVAAGVDKAYRTIDQLHDRYIAGCANLQGAELGQAIDDLCGVDRRHGNDLIEREAQAQKLAHNPGEVGHARRVAGKDVDVGGDRVGRAALRDGGLGHGIIKVPPPWPTSKTTPRCLAASAAGSRRPSWTRLVKSPAKFGAPV